MAALRYALDFRHVAPDSDDSDTPAHVPRYRAASDSSSDGYESSDSDNDAQDTNTVAKTAQSGAGGGAGAGAGAGAGGDESSSDGDKDVSSSDEAAAGASASGDVSESDSIPELPPGIQWLSGPQRFFCHGCPKKMLLSVEDVVAHVASKVTISSMCGVLHSCARAHFHNQTHTLFTLARHTSVAASA